MRKRLLSIAWGFLCGLFFFFRSNYTLHSTLYLPLLVVVYLLRRRVFRLRRSSLNASLILVRLRNSMFSIYLYFQCSSVLRNVCAAPYFFSLKDRGLANLFRFYRAGRVQRSIY